MAVHPVTLKAQRRCPSPSLAMLLPSQLLSAGLKPHSVFK